MNNDSEWVIIGKFGRPYGIKAQIKIHSFTEPLENIFTYSDWHIKIKNQWIPLTITDHGHHSNTLWVTIMGYATREKVAELTNHEIAVVHSQLSELTSGEYYWHQLEGLTVINKAGVVFGIVDSIMATGSNDVLVVKGEKRHLIPYLNAVVIKVDLNKKQIIVDWELDYS